MFIEIENLTLDGTEQEYEIPEDVSSIAFHALDGTVTMAHETGGDTWTLNQYDKEEISGRDLAGMSLFFTGTVAHTLEIRKRIGPRC